MQAQNRSLEGFWCEMAPKLGQNVKKIYLAAKLYAYSGFKRDVLTSGVGEMCLQHRSVEPARPCCFPVLKGFF